MTVKHLIHSVPDEVVEDIVDPNLGLGGGLHEGAVPKLAG